MPELSNALETVLAYHQRTKHHLHRYAASPGYLDWATQPDPFRRYEGAPRVLLPLPPEPDPHEPPAWDALFTNPPQPQPLGLGTLARFLYDSLALSAWKEAGGSRWSLRVNPSSGDLHPTEAYLILPAMPGLAERPALWHYDVLDHALERRLELPEPVRRDLEACWPSGGFWVGFTSIAWRESWKYGERAYRYCHLDVGHAWAAVALSARVGGWETQRVEGVPEHVVALLLGVHTQQGPEAERPDLLLAVTTHATERCTLTISEPARAALEAASWEGRPNRLSPAHRAWPVIDVVAGAAADPGDVEPEWHPPRTLGWPWPPRPLSARHLIRRRRSAVAMDGHSRLTRTAFLRLLTRLVPAHEPFLNQVPGWRPRVALILFVHRVEALEPGLYALLREEAQLPLRRSLRADYDWEPVASPAKGLLLHQLESGDARQAAQVIACHQEIAADGAFSAAMLADFEPVQTRGAHHYPRLYWECGVLGQLLYLEAEAAGLRGTGIGCFFDDALHQLVGLDPEGRWQDLYHFTVGGPVEDPRIRTLHAYHHRLRETEA